MPGEPEYWEQRRAMGTDTLPILREDLTDAVEDLAYTAMELANAKRDVEEARSRAMSAYGWYDLWPADTARAVIALGQRGSDLERSVKESKEWIHEIADRFVEHGGGHAG